MALTKGSRVSAWRIPSWLLLLVSAVNAIKVLRDPEAIRFFLFWIEVAVAVGAAGSVVALLIVSFRRMAGSADADTSRRIL